MQKEQYFIIVVNQKIVGYLTQIYKSEDLYDVEIDLNSPIDIVRPEHVSKKGLDPFKIVNPHEFIESITKNELYSRINSYIKSHIVEEFEIITRFGKHPKE